jgi:Tfp pilus assembly protein PilE
MKKNSGITLIALVITIIVLLILAGISIQMLTGENGILNRASDAAIQTEIARNRRRGKFNIY